MLVLTRSAGVRPAPVAGPSLQLLTPGNRSSGRAFLFVNTRVLPSSPNPRPLLSDIPSGPGGSLSVRRLDPFPDCPPVEAQVNCAASAFEFVNTRILTRPEAKDLSLATGFEHRPIVQNREKGVGSHGREPSHPESWNTPPADTPRRSYDPVALAS